MEALAKKLEFSNIGDPIRIDISVIRDLINISNKMGLEKKEDFLFLFGAIDIEGYICIHKCLTERELLFLATPGAASPLMSSIYQMAYSYGNKRKMVCCFLHISQDETVMSNEFLIEKHSECIDLRDRLNCLPIPVSCIFGKGTLDFLSKNQPIRIYMVDKVGFFDFNGIEITNRRIPEVIEKINRTIPEIIINEGNRAKC